MAKKEASVKKKGRIRKIVTPFVDVPTWMGAQQIAETSRYIAQVFKNIFIPKKPEHEDKTIEDAMARLNLTEEDIKQRIREFTRLSVFFAVAMLITISYGLYLYWEGLFKIGTMVICLSAIFFAQFFRYNFWLYQVRQRKLGCTFKEWFYNGLLGVKK